MAKKKEKTMNNSEINVCFMTDAALETIRQNKSLVFENIINHPDDTSWLEDVCPKPIYEKKKYTIKNITLDVDPDGVYKNVDLSNSIKIYEALKDLPAYIRTDERFWAWFNFEVGYKAAQQAIKLEKVSTFSDHWLFTQGERRGLMFGALSRCYYRVAMSVDESLDDPYELTKFVIEKPQRFRNLTWRSNSNEKHIVLGALKAEKAAYEKYQKMGIDIESLKRIEGEGKSDDIYTSIGVALSLLGSVKLIDIISEEEIQNEVSSFIDGYVKKHLESLVS